MDVASDRAAVVLLGLEENGRVGKFWAHLIQEFGLEDAGWQD